MTEQWWPAVFEDEAPMPDQWWPKEDQAWWMSMPNPININITADSASAVKAMRDVATAMKNRRVHIVSPFQHGARRSEHVSQAESFRRRGKT